jgi:DNA-binding IclR family transcriptional regulator
MARATKYEQHKAQVLQLIDQAARAHSRPPTVRALADALQVGVATMHSYLERLAMEGLVVWQPKSHRSLRCTPAAFQLLP